MGLIQRLSDILKSKQSQSTEQTPAEPEPQQLLREAIGQLQVSLKRNHEAVQKAVQNKNNIARQLHDYQNNVKQLQYEAVAAMKAGKELEAKSILSKKANVEQQVEQFHALYAQAAETALQVENQHHKLSVQLEELKAKEVMWSAKLESAGTQKEITSILNDLDNRGLHSLEAQVIQAQIEAGGGDYLDMELERLDKKDQDNQWKEELRKQQELVEQKQREQQQKKISTIFNEQLPKEKAIEKQVIAEDKQEKKELLKGFFEVEKFAEKPKFPAEFFEKKEEEKIPKIPADFFEQKPKELPKKEVLDDFFNAKPPKTDDDKKRKMDDFWNNS